MKEVPTGQAAGRAGLKFQSELQGWGYNGGSAEDAQSNSNIDFGYIGGFPDGKAPVPGTGMYITFNPQVAASTPGDAYGLGTLILRMLLTDQTLGSSRWELTCQVRTWVECTTTANHAGSEQCYRSTRSGFDVTDSNVAFDQWLVSDHGWGVQSTTRIEGTPRTIQIVIQGSPEMDPAQGIINLKAETNAEVHINKADGADDYGLPQNSTDRQPIEK
ncbi:MAG: hypothetical protein IT435_19210 [Phycisphaerales bacterium]|nr:hypothetical protein [Phycisphaerales bacterium]